MIITNNILILIFLLIVVVLAMVWIYDYNKSVGLQFLSKIEFYKTCIDKRVNTQK